jgi:type II secretory pathway pseudopilin PulG
MKYRYQAGISVPQVLVVLAIVLILATTFMGVVQFQLQRAKFEQATITAGYVAEIGFQQMRADLARANGDWRQVPGIVSDCSATNPNRARCQRVPQTSDFPAFRRVRENPADPNSPVIGIYEALVETGERRALFGNKTITGSATGFVPGSALPTQKVGYDVYGNELCGGTITDSACPGRFVGVRVTAWLTDRSGNIPPKTRSQTVYGVLELGAGIGEDAPSGYLLDSDQEVVIQPNTDYKWTGSGYNLELTSGLFGPVHTNKNFKFVWVNKDVPTANYQSDQLTMIRNQIGAVGASGASNPFDIITNSLQNRLYPYAGALQVEVGSTIYQPGTHFVMEHFGSMGILAWIGNKPVDGTLYDVYFNQRQTNGSIQPVYEQGGRRFFNFREPYVTAPEKVDFIRVGEGLSSIRQGGTTYTNGGQSCASGNDYCFFPDNVLLWSSEIHPARNETFIIRPIAHNQTRVFDKLTYSGDAPSYRYSHKHRAIDGSNSAAHGHNELDARTLPEQVNLSPIPVSCSTGGADTWEPCYVPYQVECLWNPELCRWHVHNITVNGAATLADIPEARNPFIHMAPTSRPQSKPKHNIPFLKPLPAGHPNGTQNYLQQLEQLNKYLQLTLGTAMPRNEDGTLNPTTLPATSDYNYGYLVGDVTKSYPDAGAVEDFRAVYFGTKLKYSAGANAGSDVIAEGSPISDTATIWVNDNPTSTGYMLVASSKVNSDYHRYTYRQIPPSQLILVRDKVVLVGNYRPATSDCSSLYADCAPTTTALDLGNATIIDGRLSIVSFTTTPPSNYTHYNKGDIVVVGNVVYRNRFYQNPNALNESRQYDPQPVAPYSSASPTSINDPSIMWVTNVDGTLSRDGEGEPLGRHNALGLYASNDVKFAVNAYYYGGSEGTIPAEPAYEQVRVMGQVVAGNRIAVSGRNSSGNLISDWSTSPVASERDHLQFFGSLYSQSLPTFGDYFRRYRLNHYDKSLFVNPLIGAPYYPKVDGDYRNQSIFNNFPKLVNGSWQAGR